MATKKEQREKKRQQQILAKGNGKDTTPTVSNEDQTVAIPQIPFDPEDPQFILPTQATASREGHSFGMSRHPEDILVQSATDLVGPIQKPCTEKSNPKTLRSNQLKASERSSKPNGVRLPTTEWQKRNQVLTRENDLPLLAAYIGPFSVDEILQGVLAYVLTANAAEAERLTGIHESTIRHWKRKQPWWDEAVAYCKQVKQDELDARFTSIIHRAADRLAQRVDEDELTARELVQVTSVIFKDRNLLRGDPTNITKKEDNVDGKMADLMLKFEEMSDKINLKTIEGETL